MSVTDGHSVVFLITNQFTTCLKLKLVHSEFDLIFFLSDVHICLGKGTYLHLIFIERAGTYYLPSILLSTF